MPEEKMPHQQWQNNLHQEPLTPCQWLMAWLAANENTAGQTLWFTDKSQHLERLALFLNAEGTESFFIGGQAQHFIRLLNEKIQTQQWSLPLSEQQIKEIISQLQLTNDDLIQDPQWQQLWAQCQEILHQSNELKGKNITLDISQLQKEVLASYRFSMLAQSQVFLFPGNKNEQELRWFPLQVCFALINNYLSLYLPDEIYLKLNQHCFAYLEKVQEKEFAAIKAMIKEGNFLGGVTLLESAIKKIASEPEYFLLEEKLAQRILTPLHEKHQQLTIIVQAIDQMIEAICSQAQPGYPLQEVIHQEIEKIKSQRLFKKMLEVGPVAVARYLNSNKIIKKIYATSLQTRVNYYEKILCEPDEDFAHFRRELKKITVYRSRCNILTQLFALFSPKQKFFMILTPAQEACLIMLQQEYLQAISRQIERMDPLSASQFLNACKSLDILQPLPGTALLKWKNDFALNELNFLIDHINLSPDRKKEEEVPLHNIDSPVEMDILGEMTRELTEAAGSEHDELEDFSLIVEVLKRSYKLLQEPGFQPQLELYEYLLEEKNHPLVIQQLLGQKNLLLRQAEIGDLYAWLKNHVDEFAPKNRIFFPKNSPWFKAQQLLQQQYWETLAAQLSAQQSLQQRDLYLLYQLLITSAEQSMVGQDYFAQHQHYLPSKIQALWQNLLNQPLNFSQTFILGLSAYQPFFGGVNEDNREKN